MSVEYSYYQNTYHGTAISAEEWPSAEARADDQLKRYERIYTVTEPHEEDRNKAICAMAEAIHGFDLMLNGEGGPVSSASIGSVSVSYGNAVAQAIDVSPRGQNRELYRCACLYLDIYRGVS